MTKSANALPRRHMNRTLAELAADRPPQYRPPPPPRIPARNPDRDDSEPMHPGITTILDRKIASVFNTKPWLIVANKDASGGITESTPRKDTEDNFDQYDEYDEYASGGITAGRARVPTKGGDYLVPADVVRALGGGDAGHGALRLHAVTSQRRHGHGRDHRAGPQPDGGYLLTAEDVAAIGGGDHRRGLAQLEYLVEQVRREEREA